MFLLNSSASERLLRHSERTGEGALLKGERAARGPQQCRTAVRLCVGPHEEIVLVLRSDEFRDLTDGAH
jgi:hypothetical protein